MKKAAIIPFRKNNRYEKASLIHRETEYCLGNRISFYQYGDISVCVSTASPKSSGPALTISLSSLNGEPIPDKVRDFLIARLGMDLEKPITIYKGPKARVGKRSRTQYFEQDMDDCLDAPPSLRVL